MKPNQNTSKIEQATWIMRLGIILILLTVSSCQSNPSALSGNQVGSSHRFVTPTPGRATIHGKLVLVNPGVTVPAPSGIYLVQIVETGNVLPISISNDSIQADVDETTGEFFITDIPKGDYAVVVLTERNQIIPARQLQTLETVLINIQDSDMDKTKELGALRIP